MIGIQILGILFVLWMTYFSFLHYRRHEFSFGEFIFWQITWVALAIVIIVPSTVNFLLDSLGVSRAFDLLTVSGITFLFGATFRNYVIVRRTERKVEDLVRVIALSDKKE